jgi:hypothetical protein
MKKVLLLTISLLLVSRIAAADHIGIYTDGTGSGCNFGVGFNSTATIIHKFSTGATGSRFKVIFPAGSVFIAFNTAFTTVGTLTSDVSVQYDECLTGTIVLGSMVTILNPGMMSVAPVNSLTTVTYTDCSHEDKYASAGQASVGAAFDPCLPPDPVESSTWGKVKALYR